MTLDGRISLPSPCLVVLVGPGASGKSTWAISNFSSDLIVSSDGLRAVVGWGEDDLDASKDAFYLLDEIVERRLARRLSTVIDTLGLNTEQRQKWLRWAREAGIACVAITFDIPAEQARAQNRNRSHPLPASAMTAQLRAWRSVKELVPKEGFDLVINADPVRIVPPGLHDSAPTHTEWTTPHGQLRFGLHVGQFNFPGGKAATRAALRTIAVSAEDAGFDSLYVMDHFRQIPQLGRPWEDFLESYTTLSYFAAITERVRLGVLVTGITYRNVAHLGKIVATIDILSGGRALCGLGLAWFRNEHVAYGWDFPDVPDRYGILEDALQALPFIWGAGSPPFQGQHLSIPETLCYPRPIQDHIPIVVGGGGEQQTLRLAARYADMANVMGDTKTVIRKREVLDAHCRAQGRDPGTIELSHLSTTLVGRDDTHLAELVETNRRRGVPKQRTASDLNAGTVSDQVVRFRGLVDAGVSEAVVRIPDPLDVAVMQQMAKVIAAFR